MIRQLVTTLGILAVSAIGITAADVEAGKAPAPRVKSAELQELDNEAKWSFEPAANRPDPLYDREAVLTVEMGIREAQERESTAATPTSKPNADILDFARDEQA